MRILVTGGLGFIGRHLVRELVNKNHEVVVIDNLHHNQKIECFSFGRNIKFVLGDIRDLALLEKELCGIEIVFHLAALSSIKDACENPKYCFSTNVTGTFNVLMAALKNKVRKIIFTSSREAYGNAKSLPVKEDAPLNPANIYGASKASCEHFCNVFRKNYKRNITVLRLTNVYGPDDPGRNRVIPTILRKIKNGEDITINGGSQILDFVWIEDVVRVLVESIDKRDNETLNVGSGRGISIKDLAEKIIKSSKSHVRLIKAPKVSNEVEKFVADISKMRIKPFPLEEGLKIMFKEYKVVSSNACEITENENI
ncbi:MAG: SDR family NAD(P)-dependent oxidoreductase [Nanoarchaeota archaeon]|nr:SDR family NAD(P)-dependent oxidoreductase [Nanoarchaeota archaeon]MBU4086034.1 SDR family NAD(P)-dependent oxidoreductase [Nanoarchaeota archaeon]